MALSVYLDASVLVTLFTTEPLSQRAAAFLVAHTPDVIVSDFAAAEFASALARKTRMGDLTKDEARAAFMDFDSWIPRAARQVTTLPGDIAAATTMVRRLDLNLRAPDALHVAIAARVAANLATFDSQLVNAAGPLGVGVAPI